MAHPPPSGDFQSRPDLSSEVCATPPESYFPDGLKRWTPDQCSAAAYVAIRRTARFAAPDDDRIPGGGLVTIGTVHGSRAGFATWHASNNSEPCRRHLGRVAFVRGRVRAVACVRPDGEQDKKLVSIGSVMLNRGQLRKTVVPTGSAFALLVQDNPRVTEVYMTNQIGICAIPV